MKTLKPTDHAGARRALLCMAAKARGAKVIALTSMAHSGSCQSRHVSGKKMYEIADVTIDNGACPGDAALAVDGLGTCIGPTSDVTGVAIAQALVCEAVERMVKAGMDVPVFKSSNVDGGDAYNEELFRTYYGYRK